MFKLCVFFAILAVALAAPAPEPQPKASFGIAYAAPIISAPAVSYAAPLSYSSYIVPSYYSHVGYHTPYVI